MDELHYAEVQLGGQTSRDNNLGATILYGAMSGLEYSTQFYNPLGLNLTGLGRVTKENMHEFQDVVDELMIKHGGNIHMPPEYRLCLSVGMLVLTVHTANSGDPALAEAMRRAHTHMKPDESKGADL